MKRKYLIKKDPAEEGQDNWIVMNSEQFLAWKETPEGQLRYNNLGRLDGCDEDDYIIYMECDEKTRVQWKKETDRQKYIRMCKKESKIEILSYHAMSFDEEELNGEDSLPDATPSVEEIIIHRMDLVLLKEALLSLPIAQQHVIKCLFLSDCPMTEREYETKFSIPQSTVNKRKLAAIKNLQKFFREKGGQI